MEKLRNKMVRKLKIFSRYMLVGQLLEWIIIFYLVVKKRLIFLHIPKNGGVSVSTSIYGMKIGHKNFEYFGLVHRITRAGIVLIYRDPVDRFFSALKYARAGGTVDGFMSKTVTEFTRNHCVLDILHAIESGSLRDPIFDKQVNYIKGLTLKQLPYLSVFNFNELHRFFEAYGLEKVWMNRSEENYNVKFEHVEIRRVKEVYMEDYNLQNLETLRLYLS